ncbi:retropepsin-like aspartic protease family protein [Beggiatoa leptomitoformis]|uniref:TIGR02281 family clan AA aspartic protease n=1 Tax=Beggiatoa leptomitoformis TaxID=288004 RepID=A0A2N9YIS4_9GAMM|nr:TIGR02281 family clan AA aspartic protease [Beggiatoa leptomitoformis]ALG67406.1 TIGR02281 family clan AA aspartic protease [Beggiatoa leptomitoformis]AUI70383.1 TIGR02281 family clan AA aspartic protease [Beggiatoa leptomitoformis]
MSNETPNRIGTGMIAVACLLSLGLLTLFFNHVLEKQHNPNQSAQVNHYQDGTTEVVLTRNQSGHYVTTGSINHKPVTFLLDTGATMVAIPENIANELELKRGVQIQVNTANGNTTAYASHLEQIAIGDIVLENINASINPQLEGDVLLGMSFLRQIEFTQRGNQLILRQHKTVEK